MTFQCGRRSSRRGNRDCAVYLDALKDWQPTDTSNLVFIPVERKAVEPEPKPQRLDTPVAALIAQSVGEVRIALAEQREEILQWVRDLLVEVTRDYLGDITNVSDKADKLRLDVVGLRKKVLKVDVERLSAENAALRTELNSLRGVVEALVGEVARLRDDLAAVEFSRSNKLIAFKGGGAP